MYEEILVNIFVYYGIGLNIIETYRESCGYSTTFQKQERSAQVKSSKPHSCHSCTINLLS